MVSRHTSVVFLVHDLALIALSVTCAVVLVQSGMLAHALSAVQGIQFLESFVAGLFFTSIFTAAPAIVALGELAQTHSLVGVVFFGALGSVIGDMIMFRFVRDRFAEHLMVLVQHRGVGKRARALFRLKLFRWLSFFVGGVIIASPLPDELGIGLLGAAHMKMPWFVLLSFVFNCIGILLIGLVAQAL